ncbi:PrsW family intramembrane metalloprotease [Candidatus Peregrinibacteria bacterium]|nr:PrsW family intramembrane metalloprotease [Candidatus Peregrinibacteria bacterium]
MDFAHFATAFFFALLPALCWLAFYYHKDYKDLEPKKVIAKTFLMGAVAGIPFLALRFFLEKYNLGALVIEGVVTVFLFAAMEEMAKLSAAIFTVTRNKIHFNQVIDGVVYAVTAALGFAFVENLFYLYAFLTAHSGAVDLLYVVAFRSFGTMLAHTLFSGIAGLIWAYAYFSKQISPFEQKKLLAFSLRDFVDREILSLHIIRHNILKALPSRRGGHEKQALVMEGMMAAVFLHAFFNLGTTFAVFGENLTFLLVPGIIGGFLYVSYLFTKKLNQKILKVV